MSRVNNNLCTGHHYRALSADDNPDCALSTWKTTGYYLHYAMPGGRTLIETQPHELVKDWWKTDHLGKTHYCFIRHITSNCRCVDMKECCVVVREAACVVKCFIT